MYRKDYKLYHEHHLSNNHGSGAYHTFLYIYFTIVNTLLCSVVSPENHNWHGLLHEYSLIVVPMILGYSVLEEFTPIMIVAVTIYLLFKVLQYSFSTNKSNSLNSLNDFGSKLACITIFRSLIYLITQFCILAVDFEMFPKYFSKTEKFGYSLMDTGVGLFVISSGLVHKNSDSLKLQSIVKQNAKLFILLVSFGAMRFYLVKVTDYQEHISEYGVHWNFFYTLAVSKTISIVLLHLLGNKNSLIVSIIIIILHQTILVIGAEDWVFDTKIRNNFWNANKEGIVSNLGYVSLYSFGVYLGQCIKCKQKTRYNVLWTLMTFVLTLWILVFIIEQYWPCSRVLANAGYCMFIAALTTTVMFLLYLFETLNFKNFHIPQICTAINNQGLFFFIVGNLLTGAINIIFYTLFLPTIYFLIILNLYMLSTIFLIVYLDKSSVISRTINKL